MKWMNSIWKSPREIQRDRMLMMVGAALCLAHVLTAYFWYDRNSFKYFSGEQWVSCYPFFKSCTEVIRVGAGSAGVILFVYGVMSFFATYCFLRRSCKLGVFLLAVLTVFKLAIFYSRYDLMGNYHLMHFAMVAAFLLLPAKRTSLLLVLCSLYFWAGLLKLNIEWMSGAALLVRPWFRGELLLTSLGYVIVLELVLIWGLLSQRQWVRLLTATQLVLFHAFSWHIVGYLYPMMMAFLLFPVWTSLTKDFTPLPIKQIPKLTWGFVFILSLINFLPKFGSDPALGGEKRIASLTMLDARSECRQIAMVESPRSTTFLSLPKIDRGIRINCDHLVFEGTLRRYCPYLEPEQSLSYAHFAKRTTDSSYSLVSQLQGFCHAD